MQTHHTIFSKSRPQRWLRIGSVLISLAAVALLATAFGAHFYSGPVFSVLLTLVLIALCVAIALHVQFLLLNRHEHRETVSALDATERQYKSVFDSALDGILILDDQGLSLEANPAALTLFGTSNAELVGQPIEKFFTGIGDFKEAWGRFLERGSEHRETRILRNNGETMFVEYTAKAHYLPGRHVAVVRDITRRKHAEDALRESEERFRQMASNIQEVFWMLDAEDLKVLYVSPAYETITGRSCESLDEDPKSHEGVIHPEDRVRVLSRLGESVHTGKLDEEFRITRPDGSIHWVWVRGFPVRDSAGFVLEATDRQGKLLWRKHDLWRLVSRSRRPGRFYACNRGVLHVVGTNGESQFEVPESGQFRGACAGVYEAPDNLLLVRHYDWSNSLETLWTVRLPDKEP